MTRAAVLLSAYFKEITHQKSCITFAFSAVYGDFVTFI